MQLLEVKKELEQCRHDLHHYQTLLEKREAELQKIHDLKVSIEDKLMQMHRCMKTDPNKAAVLQTQITEESERVDALKKILRQLDEDLDRIGEDKEHDFSNLKKKLIAIIRQQRPKAFEEYLTLDQQLSTAREKSNFLNGQKNLLEPLLKIFQEGSAINLRGGFISMFSGRHPKAVLAKHIRDAETYADKIVSEIQDIHIKKFLEKYIQEAKKNWNKALYKGKFLEYCDELTALVARIVEQVTQAKNSVVQQEIAIEQWLEKYSSEE